MSSKLSIAYDSIRSRDKAIEDLEGQIGALESDKYAALYFYEKAMKGREEWQGKAFAAEAEVAALRARVAELEAADQWRPVSEPPVEPGYYQTYTVSPPVLDHCYYNNADGWSSRYAHPDFWRPLPSPPQEAPAA